jgi:hypothetical protein
MLNAFKGIDLSTVTVGPQTLYHVMPLTALHQQILYPLNFPVEIYTRLCDRFPKPAGKIAEP